ncbi:hypothetical protein CBR_g26168 [Chara braunii]|uniref:Peptidase S9 prolyl oligopeptidase catalytic domain-containing protein n=1 Tax=Chara braunii TaxID=69332 RepID=A0A388L733_CHABU|nr:hypothetical protein CBR_g26168 [Chara braunii]|eukprot:GBG78131.1 hypothetical protein CBR_g26168 [Chara braunii]
MVLTLSPDGTEIAYVQDDELWVVSAVDGEPRQITFGAAGTGKTHGLAEYIAQEEMDRRNGFWWSPDSQLIAFAEVDTSSVPVYRIAHLAKASVGKDAEEEHVYPFAGHANVKVRLGIVPATGGPVKWMDLSCGGSDGNKEEEYLARVMWLPEGKLLAQIQNRAQTVLNLVQFDPRTGRRTLMLVEENLVWVTLHDCFAPLQKASGHLAGGLIWGSERTGFRHLYLYDGRMRCLGPLTSGEWMVEQVAGVDEKAGLVYFTGTKDGPLETHLYVTGLSVEGSKGNQGIKKLTQAAGRHAVVLDHHLKRFIDAHDSLNSPPTVLLCSLEDGAVLCKIYEPPSSDVRVQRLQQTPPEIVRLQRDDGTVLYGALYRPDASVFGKPPYRTVVSVYGGPHVQTVCNSWMTTVDMRAQYLSRKGILVWKLDNRGSSRRGLAFEAQIKHKMGTVEVDDQAFGVQWLIEQGLTDAWKVGIYGWSYGGYMAAMALARYPAIFRVAVAGAAVTFWEGYDTHYTERYMGSPQENAEAYKTSSVMHWVSGMQGELMLVHGMIDENVHFRHTARLINALTGASKEHGLMLFPNERHMPRDLKDRMYMEERIFKFLDRNL